MASTTSAGGTWTAATCTLTSLSSSATAGRESTTLALTSNIDTLIQVKFKLTTGTIANDKGVYIYVAGGESNSYLPDALTGSDAAYTFYDPTNLFLLWFQATPTQNLTYITPALSVARFYPLGVPAKLSIAIRNYSGIAFTSTGSDHEVRYQERTLTTT